MAEINYNGNIITLSHEYVGTSRPWDGKYEKYHFEVFVKNDNGKTSFDFYCDESGLNDDSEVEAFYFFLSDGIAYDNARDIDDFQSEFGYTKVSDCLRAYKGCKNEWKKWNEIGGDINPYDLCNWLQEKYNL